MGICYHGSVLLLWCFTLSVGAYSDLYGDGSDKRQDLLPFPRIGRAALKRQGLIPFPRTGRSTTRFYDPGESLEDVEDANWEPPFDFTFLVLPYKKRHNNGFTPRIGKRKKRSVSNHDDENQSNGNADSSNEHDPKKAVAIFQEPLFAPQSLLFERALRQLIPGPRFGRSGSGFVPRIGKKSINDDLDSEDSAMKRAAFTPRIGRAAFTPRIGRASFTPRIGRSGNQNSGCKMDQ